MAVVRVSLAVVLALALVAGSLPAVEDATADRADAVARGEVAGLTDAIRALRRGGEPLATEHGSRRTIEVRVPTAPFDGGVDYVAIGGVPGGNATADGPRSDVIAVGRERRPPTRYRVDVDLRVAGVADDDTALVLRDDATVRLAYVARDGRPTVRVARGFKSGDGTTDGDA